MNFYRKLIVSLALVSGIAAGLLSHTYTATAPIMEMREREEREKAMQDVFFLQAKRENGENVFLLDAKRLADGVTALYAADNPDEPAYYAAVGSATGYNSSVPITLVVGFTGPAKDSAELLKGYVDDSRLPAAGERDGYIVGFSVAASQETPGLGERIKDVRPPFTWTQFVRGDMPPPDPDRSTPFQSQFRGRRAESLLLKKNGGDLDAITASTITSNAVLAAIRDAGEKLRAALRNG